MLSRICRLMCVPTTPVTIRLLKAWSAGRGHQDAPSPERLVSIELGDRSVAGVVVPTTPADLDSAATRPQIGLAACLASRMPMDLDEESRLLLANMYPGLGDPALPGDRSASAAASSQTTGAEKVADKMMMKLWVHTGAAKGLFGHLREVDLARGGDGGRIHNADPCHQCSEVGGTGCREFWRVCELADTWLEGLQQAKMFVKKYTDSFRLKKL